MSTKTVTVIGGSGFVGRYIVKRLAKQGARVRVAVRRPSGAEFLKVSGDVGQIVPFACNVRDPASVRQAVEGADEVVYLPGLLFQSGKQRFRDIHAAGAGRTAQACADAGIEKMVLVSAIGANQQHPAQYAQTKAAGEHAVMRALPSATILRPSIIFGPEDGFFNRFGAMARTLPFLPLIGGGETKFQPVYVGDVADATLAALDSEDARGQVYELGGSQVYSFKELMLLLLKHIERERILLPVPWSLASLQASILGLLPVPPLTTDQVTLLKYDNVVDPDMPGLEALGVRPTSLEAVLPTYITQYRRGGQWAPFKEAR